MSGRRAGGGYSTSEILVAMGLFGAVMAGAFHMQSLLSGHAQRQEQVADIQQTLRIAMSIMERAVRGAGAGMVGRRMSLMTCGGPRTLYGLSFSNSNAYPQAAFDSVAGDADADADWLRVIAMEEDLNLATADDGTSATVHGPLSGWAAGDLMLLVKPRALSPNHCLREVTSVGPAALVHGTATSRYPCANDLPNCMAGTSWPAPVRRFRFETTYRVIPGTGADAPRLAQRRARIGDALPADCDFETIVEDIEDMQIALIQENGQICMSVDDPALCDPARTAAVRLTLTARSSSPSGQPAPSVIGGYEDRPAALVQDRHSRRSLTAEIGLRN